MGSNFSIYVDNDKKTSGHRFFQTLKSNLSQFESNDGDIILYNLSASIKQILYSRLRRKCIILRVDGLYHDKFNEQFYNEFNIILKLLFKLMYFLKINEDKINFLANVLNENYKAYIRIILSNHIIYQSNFSLLQHRHLKFPKKNSIILNASNLKENITKRDSNCINLITIYDEWKPSKQLHILFYFMIWLEKKKIKNINLTVLGYTGNYPYFITCEQKKKFENCKNINFLPRFEQIDNNVEQIYQDKDIFITFSFRDPCPNVVIESMSFGLPVISINSGGIREIVKDAGILIDIKDDESNIYSPSRFSNKFPSISFLKVYNSINYINNNKNLYKNFVINRFKDELDISIVSKKYLDYINNIKI